MCKDICCIVLLVFLILILINVVRTRVTEYYEQMDPMLVRIRETLLPLHPCVVNLKFYEGKKSYTINKKKVYLCLKDDDGEYYNFNMLIYVSIHELSHVICDEIGHTAKFHRIFRDLLELAEQKNIYDSSIPIVKNYCGHN